jgi:hypothetical protein
MALDLGPAAAADGAAAGLVLQAAENVLDGGPGVVADGFGERQVDRAAGQFCGVLVRFLSGGAGATASISGTWPRRRATPRSRLRGEPGGCARGSGRRRRRCPSGPNDRRTREAGNAAGGDGGQGSCDLAVVEMRACRGTADRDVAIGYIDVPLVTAPDLVMAFGVLFGAETAGARQIGEHDGERHGRLPFQAAR